MSYLTTTNLIKLIIDNKATKIELWATWNRRSKVRLSLKIIHVEIGTQRNMPIFVKHGADSPPGHVLTLHCFEYSMVLVTQPIMQRRPIHMELRPMD